MWPSPTSTSFLLERGTTRNWFLSECCVSVLSFIVIGCLLWVSAYLSLFLPVDFAGLGIGFATCIDWCFFPFRSFRWTKKCAGRCTALNVWAHWIWTRTCRIWSVPRKCSPMTIANSWRNTCPPVLKVSNCVPSDCRQEKWDVTNVPFCQTGYPWTLVFSTSENGFSLSSLYRKMMGIDSPILLVIEDTQGNVSLSVWTA